MGRLFAHGRAWHCNRSGGTATQWKLKPCSRSSQRTVSCGIPQHSRKKTHKNKPPFPKWIWRNNKLTKNPMLFLYTVGERGRHWERKVFQRFTLVVLHCSLLILLIILLCTIWIWAYFVSFWFVPSWALWFFFPPPLLKYSGGEWVNNFLWVFGFWPVSNHSTLFQ